MCKFLALLVCLVDVAFAFTYYSCSGDAPLIRIGVRGTQMRTYNAASLTKATYTTSTCTRLYCRRLKPGYLHWVEKSAAECSNSAQSCYTMDSTQAVPIIANRGIGKCEQLTNVALVGGSLATPSSDGNYACNTRGRTVWMYADSYMDSNLACPNFNQCAIENGWCAASTSCTDVGGEEGHRTCGPCPSGTYGNGEGQAVCPSCPVGKYSQQGGATSTACVACTSTCPAGQGATSQCTLTGRTTDRVCGPCAAGRFSNGTSLLCAACSTGCPPGQGLAVGCVATARTIDRVCSACAVGKFQLGGSMTCSNCSTCPRGKGLSKNCTLSSDIVCSNCTSGKYSYGGVLPCPSCSVCPSNSTLTRECQANNDTECTPHLVGNCTNGVSVTVVLGKLGNVSCLSNSTPTPRFGPPPVSVVVDIKILDANGKEIPVSGLQKGQLIEFFLPFSPDALAHEENSCGLNDRARDLECAWWDEEQQAFVSSGCQKTLVNASGVMCSCSHLTEFALILKMSGICKQELSPQEFVLMGLYLLIFFAALYQALRLVFIHTKMRKGLTTLRNEHLLVALIALLRGIQIVLRGTVSAPFLAILAGVPHTFELGLYSFVVFAWVGGVLMEASINPFQKLKYHFVATMVFFAAITIGFPIAIDVIDDVTLQMSIARIGSYTMGAVTYLGTSIVLFFGVQLYRKLHKMRITHSSGGSQTLALKILKLTIAVSFQFCVIATLWIVMVTEEVINDDLAFPILQFLYHFADAMLLVTLLVMFSKAVSVQSQKSIELSSGDSVLSSSRSTAHNPTN